MQKEVVFPTVAEVKYLADIKISNNPKLSEKQAIEKVHVELSQVLPESLSESLKNTINTITNKD